MQYFNIDLSQMFSVFYLLYFEMAIFIVWGFLSQFKNSNSGFPMTSTTRMFMSIVSFKKMTSALT